MPFRPELIERLSAAERVAVLTGAGVSAESGVPTFRDPGGLWQQYRPEDLANADAFRRNPALVQGWYAHRRQVVRAARPNPAHRALAALEQRVRDFTLVTQNVDDLHQRAGSRNLVALHGSLLRAYCIDCGAEAEDLAPSAGGEPACCRACGGYLRPGVVWFGEALPARALEAAYAAAGRAEVFLSIGTSAVVYPAAHLPVHARAHGAYVAEVNVTPSALAADVDEVVLGKAGEVLPALLSALPERRRAVGNPS
jgi:NAD-dependent deacetylase